MEKIITLDKTNIDKEHICCAFSDKKCAESYEQKKSWLMREFDHGYVFRRIDARAKVFIEYGPAEKGWVPVTAPNYLLINCFWVSGQYKGQGYGKALLQLAINDAESAGKNGLIVYYSNRCPFTEFHVRTSLIETAKKRKLPLTIVRFESFQAAQSAPGPATIFSLFYNGRFVTTDLSVCMDSRFDKVMEKKIL